MDYEEFLWAIGDNATFSLLKKCFEMDQGLGDAINSLLLASFPPAHCIFLTIDLPDGNARGFPCFVVWTVAMHLGSIFRPEVLCPFDIAHIETAISPPSYLLVWCIIHFHHFKYHDPYNDLHMLTLCIHPWQLGGCGYRLSALSHCFTPFITYRAFRGRDITNGYDSVEAHFKQRPSGRTNMILTFPSRVW